MHKNKREIGIENIPETKAEPDKIPILDEDYERSLINILPEGLAKWVRRVPEEWFLMDEAQLKALHYPEIGANEQQKKMPKGKHGRSTYMIDQQLRMAFWAEYDSAQNNQRKFIARHVYMNILHISNWYNCVLPNARRMAWILCPPGSYVAKTMQLYMSGIELMQEYLELGVQKDEKGNIDAKLAAVQQKIVDGATVRVRGSIPMNVTQKTVSFNVNKNIDGSNPTAHGAKIEDIEADLEKLRVQVFEQEQKQIAATSVTAPDMASDGIIDITPEEEPIKESIDAK